MSGTISVKKAIAIIVVSWILSLITTLAVTYVLPSVFPLPIKNGSVTSAKLAPSSVTSSKLGPNAIPFVSLDRGSLTSTTETANWVDMFETSVSLTLDRPSNLLIMFNVEAWNDNIDQRIKIRALVDDVQYAPEVELTPKPPLTPRNFMRYSFNFLGNYPGSSADAGTHIIKIQWRISGGLGSVLSRTLFVIALPA